MKKYFITLFFLLNLNNLLASEPQTIRVNSLSVYDQPTYTSHFSHFNYVNPQAPKGGKITLPAYGGFETINPWLAVLANLDWYQELVKDTWTAAYDDKVFERALQMIKTDAENCKTAFANNYLKWNNIINNEPFANELSKKSLACKNETEAIDYLYEWLETRINFLNEQWHR